jgi:RNA polymerase sigma factor (sigma-70 family)
LPAGSDIPGTPRPPASSAHEAVANLYRDHHGNLLRFLRARLRDPHDAKDVAQDTYLSLLRHPQALLTPSYLFTAAANITRNLLRMRDTHRRLDPLIMFDGEDSPTPERAYATEQELALISAALRNLPPSCVRAVLLVSESDYDQAARAMQLSSRQVRRLVARATEYLHHFLTTHQSGRRRG